MGGRPRWPIAVPLPRKSVATMSKSALELEREARIGERCLWGPSHVLRCGGAGTHPAPGYASHVHTHLQRVAERWPEARPQLKRPPSSLPPCPAANKARLAEIGLVQTVQAIATAQTEQARARRATKAANRAARKAAGAAPAGRVRRCAALCCDLYTGYSPCWVRCDVWRRPPVLAARGEQGDCWCGSAAVGGLGWADQRLAARAATICPMAAGPSVWRAWMHPTTMRMRACCPLRTQRAPAAATAACCGVRSVAVGSQTQGMQSLREVPVAQDGGFRACARAAAQRPAVFPSPPLQHLQRT